MVYKESDSPGIPPPGETVKIDRTQELIDAFHEFKEKSESRQLSAEKRIRELERQLVDFRDGKELDLPDWSPSKGWSLEE